MARHNRTGKEGEALAARFLEDAGYVLLHRNWRHGRDELDVVALRDERLVVVEVKTRHGHAGHAEDLVGAAKQRRMVRAAEAYLAHTDLDLAVRFDILHVDLGPEGPRFELTTEAFYPTPDESTE